MYVLSFKFFNSSSLKKVASYLQLGWPLKATHICGTHFVIDHYNNCTCKGVMASCKGDTYFMRNFAVTVILAAFVMTYAFSGRKI